MSLGCQHFERAKECRALADSVNPELTDLAEVYTKRSPAGSEQFHEVSRKYAAAAKRVASLKLRDEDLRRYAKELAENLTAVGRSCDRVANTLQHEVGPDHHAQREFEGYVQHHHSTVAAIARRCGPQ